MILYFSATGNSKHVAKTAAAAVSQSLLSIEDAVRNGQNSFEDEVIGIVTPTYYGGLPANVESFLKNSSFKADYLFFLATYGMKTGGVDRFAAKALGREFDAAYSVKMPDTCTYYFDVTDQEKIRQTLKEFENQIRTVISHVQNRDKGRFVQDSLPMWIAKPFHGMYEKGRRTSHLHVGSSCNGCGMCVKFCPAQAMEMESGGRPDWTHDQCIMCLRCLHECPQFAIQYDDKTSRHGQYVYPEESSGQNG